MAVAVAGCRTTQYVPVVEHHADTLRQRSNIRDSIFVHDSTLIREFYYGDTVRIITEMWHTQHHDRLKTDTIYQSRTDSVPVPYPVVKEVKKPLSFVEDFLMGTGVAAIAGLLFFCLFFVKKKLP